jgi:GTP-binding protein EngB required for normal cell division
MNLRDYERAKFELSEILRSATALSADRRSQEMEDHFRDLFVRLAEDRFNLVVAGRFNRGKSSLMNALLGTDRLPTGIVPLTSVITTVRYGSVEKVTLQYRERRLDNEVGLSKLAQYVTQQGNPGNTLGIATANIELPAEILRRGFYFVDTPGLGSVISENTQTTEAYMPQADALLLVTSFESPLSQEELSFFGAASRSHLPVFVIINKHDIATATERAQAISFVRSHLSHFSEQSLLGVFSVSARDGLTAKLSHDDSVLRDSGIPDLEERLVQFLLERKRAVFLTRMHSRVDDLIDQLPHNEEFDGLRQRFEALNVRFQESHEGADTEAPEADFKVRFNRNQLRSCQVCSEIEAATWEFLARFQYELSTRRETQTDFALRSGFCCYHTWEYQGMASSFGTCSGYPALLERVADALTTIGETTVGDLASRIEGLLPKQDQCVVCEVRENVEAAALAKLSDRFRNHRDKALDDLSAICLPHLSALTKVVGDAEIAITLASHHAKTFERVAEDMRRFTLKQSAARRYLETKEEESAAQRALYLLAGHRNVNFSVGAKPTCRGASEVEINRSGRQRSGK